MQEPIEQDIIDALVKVIQLPKPHDIYTWQVTYADNAVTHEFDAARPDGRGWAEREEKPVQRITLARVDDGIEVRSIDVPEGAEPVFFRRRAAIASLEDGSIHRGGTLAHCIGWKQDSRETYLFVFEDGSTLLTNDLQAV